MSVEKIVHKVHMDPDKAKEILHTENLEKHLTALSDQLFKQDMEVGFGNYSRVYRDPEAGLVYKKLKAGEVPKNNVHEEARYLSQLTQTSEDVIVPLPVVSFTAYLKKEGDGKMVQQNVLVMQEIEGFPMDRMLPKNPGDKPEIDFPVNFDPDPFFKKLRTYVEWMHSEKKIYHRDLFARNIMIDTETGKPVIIDFGNSAEFEAEFAEPGEMDAYGRNIVGNADGDPVFQEDEDLKNLTNLEEEVRRFLTNNQTNVY